MKITLLDHLWSNALSEPERIMLSAVPDLLGRFTSTPVVALRTELEGSSRKATVAYADEEILPGVTLADMLCEECDIHVPGNAIVYIETTALSGVQNTRSVSMAALIGQLVIKLATRAATGALIDVSARDVDLPPYSTDVTTRARVGAVVQ